MLVTSLNFDPLSMRSIADSSPHIQSRSPGLHLSQIYADIEDTLAPRDDMEQEALNAYRAGGFLWERVFSQAMGEAIRGGNIVYPGEFMVDGISGSPDNMELLPDGTWRVIDTKCTWRSVQKFDDHLEKFFWTWLVQGKGYCRMTGCFESVLYVFFVNGNYRGSGPVTRGIKINWTQQEVNESWQMITGHARRKGWLL